MVPIRPFMRPEGMMTTATAVRLTHQPAHARFCRSRDGGLLNYLLVSVLALMLSGCATAHIASEWVNHHYAGKTLKGRRIFVVCHGPSIAIQRFCEDEIATALVRHGSIPLRRETVTSPDVDVVERRPSSAYLGAAEASGAAAVLSMDLQPNAITIDAPGLVRFSLRGDRSAGERGNDANRGRWVAFPGRPWIDQHEFATSTSIVDTASGESVWSGRAVTSRSDTFEAQVIELNRVTFKAFHRAGLL